MLEGCHLIVHPDDVEEIGPWTLRTLMSTHDEPLPDVSKMSGGVSPGTVLRIGEQMGGGQTVDTIATYGHCL